MSNVIIPTGNQKRLAECLVEGERSTVDCYIEAYKQRGEQLEDRQKLAARAYMASKSKGVLYWIQKIQEQQAVEEARLLVWDKRKASKRLLSMINEIQVNVEIVRRLRDKMLDEPGSTSNQLTQMMKVAQICNDTTRAIREVIKDMNDMHGLTQPSVSMTNAVQIIIGGAEALPEDDYDLHPLREGEDI